MPTAVTDVSKGGSSSKWSWLKNPWVKRVAWGIFFIAVGTLLVHKGSELEWEKILDAFRKTPMSSLVLGAGVGLLCYSAYALYDLLGCHVFGIKVNRFGAWSSAWISYACNLNLGALVGSVAFRYRLYSRLDVAAGDVTRILGVTVLSNWLGYCLLAGTLFIFGFLDLPENWAIGQMGLKLVGAVLVGVVLFYLYLSIFSERREFQVRSQTIYLPTLNVVGLQFLISITHWSLMAAVVYIFMPEELGYFTVYAVLLISGIAGAVSHVPGGLGVLEAVFIAMLAGRVDKHSLLAALFAYRCVFYLLPLAIAIPGYLLFESQAKRLRSK